jgi:flagellar hook-basal body complex protein FliE
VIPPLGAIPPAAAGAVARPTPPVANPGEGFAGALQNGLQQISDLEHRADALIEDVAVGGPTQIHEVMAATTESALAVDLLVQVRDRALNAYQEIMRMQI